jgi:predicted CoA-substrate-specific enzyme activase
LERAIAFQGGVAHNKGVVRAFEELLELQPGELFIPPHFDKTGALGAILETQDKSKTAQYVGAKGLDSELGPEVEDGKHLEPLTFEGDTNARHYIGKPECPPPAGQKTRAYLGIDVGSISTNVVAIDEAGNVLAKRYLMTAGRPLEAVRQGLQEIGEEIGDRIEILGCGTTGSGRYLTGDFVGADTIRNEITAQATAAAWLDPEVDTIFEIGGQDSKYISLKNGVVVDFEMNHVCAAGTGSFLEEQAERLGIDIKGEFGRMAISCPHPLRLGERCTVFMESDVVHHQARGAKTGELVSGLAYSIVHNYLHRVVGDRRIGRRIFLQGGTMANAGVVAAFEKIVGQPMIVPGITTSPEPSAWRSSPARR